MGESQRLSIGPLTGRPDQPVHTMADKSDLTSIDSAVYDQLILGVQDSDF